MSHSSAALKGRVAIVTGASSGIGAATARAFGAAGAHLVLTGRNAERLKAVADDIVKQHGAKVVTHIGDAGLESTQKAIVDLAISTYGALHISFNNAGTLIFGKLTDVQAKDVDTHFDGNVKSIIYALKYQIPAMAKSSTKDDWGVIINNSSVVSARVKSGMEGMAVYSATKSAVDTLTKFGALEAASSFVRVNSVNPGNVASEGVLELFGGEEKYAAGVAAAQLSHGAATTDELAAFVTFVADNKTGRFFNGSNLLIDGGMNIK